VPVAAITGSTGKTTVKDIARALLGGRVHASPENYNTEVGLPLAILSAPPETELLVLEMAMRGMGQIAELCTIAEPDVAVITNVGPVHLELLGTFEAIVEAKAEILAGLRDGGHAVVPADDEALEPHLADELDTVTFGSGGDVFVRHSEAAGDGTRATIVTPVGVVDLELPFTGAHNLTNTACAVAIGVALGQPVEPMARRAPDISFSRLRGALVHLPAGAVLINDCYNANPISMQAALDHLVALETGGDGKRIAVLGGMAELGPDGPAYHREAAAHARGLGIETIVGVGELARDYGADEWVADPLSAVDVIAGLLGPGDAVLVKGSRSVGLEEFTDGLVARVSL
jgi:UDP-N-acetylmuramoyl-tripeptide--D-alanyl-D-alanine ligase